MVDFEPGQRVEADITGTMPMSTLVAGCITPGTIVGPGTAPGTFIVQTDVSINGNDRVQLAANRLSARSN